MITKIVEIRDRGTFIPALAIRLQHDLESYRHLLAMAGYGNSIGDQGKYILLLRLTGGSGEYSCDPYDWTRTMRVAHDYLIKNWEQVKPADVIDVEFILGEKAEPSKPERTEDLG